MSTEQSAPAEALTDERAAFERWFSDDVKWPAAVGRYPDGEYRLASAASAWNVWQARAALAAATGPKAEPDPPAERQSLIEWVVERWTLEVRYRPLVNVHRRSLDDTWRQVLRHLGVDDRARLGPTHDELRANHPEAS